MGLSSRERSITCTNCARTCSLLRARRPRTSREGPGPRRRLVACACAPAGRRLTGRCVSARPDRGTVISGVLDPFLDVRKAVMKQGVVHNVAGKQQVCAWSLRRSRPSSVCESCVRLRGKDAAWAKRVTFPAEPAVSCQVSCGGTVSDLEGCFLRERQWEWRGGPGLFLLF